MPLETGVTGIEDLNPSWPTGTDPKSEGDDHLRNIKAAVQGSFPNMVGPNEVSGQFAADGFDANDGKIVNVANGTEQTDGVNKSQVDRVTSSWGVVGKDGNNTATPGTYDWASARLGLGWYRIQFGEAVVGNFENQAMTVSINQQDSGTHNRSINIQIIDATHIDVHVYNTVLNAKVDDDFAFIRYANA